MKNVRDFILIFLFTGFIYGQTDYSPIPLYWKTLKSEEKEIYLFGYLTQVYDTHKSLISETGRGEFTKWYYDNRAELAYNIFDLLDTIAVTKFVGWVDDFYSHQEYRERSFPEALKYAYDRSQMKGQTLLEKYDTLMRKKKKAK
ncbi:MAG: hypothetical protein CMG75_01945 [Candidatus Marinimicrobia bacterium]|nr:hypothetical protein [Candidatus Neomarinimicrobiota bacterium]|tara:strand:+ start:24689 stop:25120 length:432 start_codon:yes stop_codon:yes gene_type:complete